MMIGYDIYLRSFYNEAFSIESNRDFDEQFFFARDSKSINNRFLFFNNNN
jgi:hypothetical protein